MLVVLALAWLAAGCAEHGGLPLAEWTLHAPGVSTRRIELPVQLNDVLPERRGTYRLVRSVTLPPELVGLDLELVLTHLPAPVRLQVDGQPVAEHERAGVHNEYGGDMPHRFRVPAAATIGGALRFELEVTHVWTLSGWLDSVPELLPAGAPAPRAERNEALNELGGWFGLIALSQVGITFLVVYFWDRRRRAYLWFAIQALTASYYPAYVLGLPSHWLSWPVQNVLLAQTLAVAPIISVDFTHEFFGLRPPHRVWRLLLVVALASPLSVAVRDAEFHDLTYAAPIVVVCVLSGVLYQLATGFRLLRSDADRGTVVFFLLCWLALAGSSWVDLLAWLGVDVMEGGRPACLGLGLFGIFQSLLLGRSHFRSLAEADRLTSHLRSQVHDLEERQQEIASLNEQLRRQIGKRSAEILAALTAKPRRGEVRIEPGHVVEGLYRVTGTLGTGGMGTVYRAVRIADDKVFALKVSQDIRGLALARLAKEAQIATRVQHPNVVSFVDADVAQDGYVYVVMELVEGSSLAELSPGRPLGWCLHVLQQTLEGVRALHAEGVIHRDLKPGNILIAREDDARPAVKITDFGISHWLTDHTDSDVRFRDHADDGDDHHDPTDHDGQGDRTTEQRLPHSRSRRISQVESLAARSAGEALGSPRLTQTGEALGSPRLTQTGEALGSPRLTQTGAITGTPRYTAPELADRHAPLTPAVDVYSFGVVAHLVLTGKLPHVEPPLIARLSGREITPPPPVATACAGLDPELGALLDACLDPDPAGRPGVEPLLERLTAALEQAATDSHERSGEA